MAKQGVRLVLTARGETFCDRRTCFAAAAAATGKTRPVFASSIDTATFCFLRLFTIDRLAAVDMSFPAAPPLATEISAHPVSLPRALRKAI